MARRANRSSFLSSGRARLTASAIRPPGNLVSISTAGISLAFARLTGSSMDDVRSVVCVNHLELSYFMKQHSLPGVGISIFDFSRLTHKLADNLLRTPALKRGRSADQAVSSRG
jgi:hypothetical protein